LSRQQEYQKLAKEMFELVTTEESAELIAQWTILGKRYLEISKQGPNYTRKTRRTNRIDGPNLRGSKLVKPGT